MPQTTAVTQKRIGASMMLNSLKKEAPPPIPGKLLEADRKLCLAKRNSITPGREIWRNVKKLKSQAKSYNVLSWFGIDPERNEDCLTGNNDHDLKLIKQRRNLNSQMFVPQLFDRENVKKKMRRQYLMRISQINEAYSLILKKEHTRKTFLKFIKLRENYSTIVEWAMFRQQVKLTGMLDQLRSLLSEFKQSDFPLQPIEEAKLAAKTIQWAMLCKDVLYVVEQSSRITPTMNRTLQTLVQQRPLHANPIDTVGLAIMYPNQYLRISDQMKLNSPAYGAFRHWTQKIGDRVVQKQLGIPDMCQAIEMGAVQLLEKGEWVQQWLICIFANDADATSQSYNNLKQRLQKMITFPLSIVCLMVGGSKPALFNQFSEDFPREESNLRFYFFNGTGEAEDLNVLFKHANALMASGR